MSPPKAVFRAFFLENHFFDPFRPHEDPQVLYMAGKLWISSFWWYKEKNICFHPSEPAIFYDGPHRYFPLYWEAVINKFCNVATNLTLHYNDKSSSPPTMPPPTWCNALVSQQMLSSSQFVLKLQWLFWKCRLYISTRSGPTQSTSPNTVSKI